MRLPCRLFLFGAIVSALAACGGAGGVSPQTPEQRTSSASRVTASFNYSVHPRARRITDLLLHNCAGTGNCLSPTTVRSGYNFSYVPGTQDGTGQRLVIVDAFGSPTIASDLKKFDATFGLPDPSLTIVYPGGKPSIHLTDATQLGWAEETSLDVEWAHAAAPGAAIVLVVSSNDQGQTIQSAQQYAVATYPNSALSLSFGVQELAVNGGANNTQLAQAEQIYTQAAINHVTVVASAGDLGATGGFSTANPQYPASDPHVLAVGGTNLTLFHNGSYRNESVWNDGDNCISPCVSPGDGATGGAPSTIFDNSLLPNQKLLTGLTRRGVADVAYNASPNTGVVVYIGFKAPGISPGFYAIGGTSQGPPQFAGIITVANQLRAHLPVPRTALGFVTDRLYGAYTLAQTTKSPPFHDITVGDNVFPTGAAGYSAAPGYDFPTGLGSPNINSLLNLLVNQVP